MQTSCTEKDRRRAAEAVIKFAGLDASRNDALDLGRIGPTEATAIDEKATEHVEHPAWREISELGDEQLQEELDALRRIGELVTKSSE